MPAKKRKRPIIYTRLSRRGVKPNKIARARKPTCKNCKGDGQVWTCARLGYPHFDFCPTCQSNQG